MMFTQDKRKARAMHAVAPAFNRLAIEEWTWDLGTFGYISASWQTWMSLFLRSFEICLRLFEIFSDLPCIKGLLVLVNNHVKPYDVDRAQERHTQCTLWPLHSGHWQSKRGLGTWAVSAMNEALKMCHIGCL